MQTVVPVRDLWHNQEHLNALWAEKKDCQIIFLDVQKDFRNRQGYGLFLSK